MTATVTAISDTAPVTVRRGRKTGQTYEMFQGLPFDQWATIAFADLKAATAASSTLRTIGRREGVQVSVRTDSENEKLLYVLKTKETGDETAD